MQELLSVFEREGDFDLLRQKARADSAREIKALAPAFWRQTMRLVASEPRGQFAPAR